MQIIETDSQRIQKLEFRDTIVVFKEVEVIENFCKETENH